MRFRPAATFSCFLIVTGLVSNSFADTLLQMKFTPDETIRHDVTMKMNQEMTVPGQPTISIKMTQVMNLVMTVDKVGDDGLTQVRQRIPRMRMTMEMPLPVKQNMVIDTDGDDPVDPQGKLLAKTLKGMTTGEFRMNISRSGDITDIVIPQEMLDSAKQNPALAQMGNMFSEDGLKQMTKTGQVVFPKKPLNKGDSWDELHDVDSPLGTLRTSRKYTYLGAAEGQEKIGIEASVELIPKVGSPLKVTFKPNKGKGEMLFDNKLGRMTKSSVSAVLETEIEAGAQTILQKVITDTEVKLVTAPATKSESTNSKK